MNYRLLIIFHKAFCTPYVVSYRIIILLLLYSFIIEKSFEILTAQIRIKVKLTQLSTKNVTIREIVLLIRYFFFQPIMK